MIPTSIPRWVGSFDKLTWRRILSAERSRVLLADDHGLIAAGIRELLEARFHVLGIVGNGKELVERAQVELPDVVVADLSMPEMDGLEATRKLREILPTTPVIILTMHDDAGHVQAAFEAGAMGFLVKSSAPRELFEAIRVVLLGGRYVSSEIAGQVVSTFATPRPEEDRSPLTPREREISTLVGEGLENAEIADRLCIAEVTVRTHFQRILRKLGLRNRVEVARHALAEGWTSQPVVPRR